MSRRTDANRTGEEAGSRKRKDYGGVDINKKHGKLKHSVEEDE